MILLTLLLIPLLGIFTIILSATILGFIFHSVKFFSLTGAFFKSCIHFCIENVYMIIFSILSISIMYLCKIPLKEGFYMSIFFVIFLQFIIRKTKNALATGKVEFHDSDLLQLIISIIMLLFSLLVVKYFNSLWAEALLTISFAASCNFEVPNKLLIGSPNNYFASTSSTTPTNLSGSPSASVGPGQATSSQASSRLDPSTVSSSPQVESRNVLAARLFAVKPSGTNLEGNWSLSASELGTLNQRFKNELVHFLLYQGHLNVNTQSPTGIIDKQEHIASLYPSRKAFDEYFLYKMSYQESFKESLSDADKVAYKDKFRSLKQSQLDTWSQGRIHFIKEMNKTQESHKILLLGVKDGLKPDSTVPSLALPRFLKPPVTD